MSPSFCRQPTSNYVPNSQERTAIEGLSIKLRQKQHSLAAEISQHEAILLELLQRRDAAHRQIIAHSAFIAPIRRLPPEILETVFLYCLSVDRNPVMSSQEAPILLGRVCSHWRTIAYTTSKLWKAIHVVIPIIWASSYSLHKGRIQAIIQWLSRAGSQPLDISIFSATVWNHWQMHILQGYLDTFLPSMLRWKSFRLNVPGGPFWEDFLLLVKELDVPLLEILYLDRRDDNDDDSESIVAAAKTTGLIRAPKLHSLSVPAFEFILKELPIRWEALREVDLSCDTYGAKDVIEILSKCHNLCYFSVRVGRPSGIMLFPAPRLNLPKLLSLTVIDKSMSETAHLFDCLYVPALRHLSYCRVSLGPITRQNTNRAIFIRALFSLLNRCAVLLEELELHTSNLSNRDVRRFLSKCPTIKRLALLDPSTWDSYKRFNDRMFMLQDEDLREFIPRSIHDDNHVIPSSSRSTSSTSSSSLSWLSDEDALDSYSPTNEQDIRCLCPNLEIFHCRGASFSNSTLIDFLQTRSAASITQNQSSSPITASLRRVNVEFEAGHRPLTKSARKRIENLRQESNMVVNITYSAVAIDPILEFNTYLPCQYSPYNGIVQDTMMVQLPMFI